MTDKWTLRYQQDGNRVYWQIDGADLDDLKIETRYSANRYASFYGWDFNQQCHGYASSPHGLSTKGARAYFLRELRELARNVFGDDHYDRQHWPAFSVRKVTDLV